MVIEKRRPILFVECKWADAGIDRSLAYLKTRFPKALPPDRGHAREKSYVTPEGIRAYPAVEWLGPLV